MMLVMLAMLYGSLLGMLGMHKMLAGYARDASFVCLHSTGILGFGNI